MPRYNVQVFVSGSVFCEIDADNEESAKTEVQVRIRRGLQEFGRDLEVEVLSVEVEDE